jgi:hypothetical protein
MNYRILVNHSDNNSKVLVPIEFLHAPNEINTKYVFISFGQRKVKAEIDTDKCLECNEIMVSKDIADALYLNLEVEYQLKYDKNTIRIGPVIGLLLGLKKNDISNNLLKRALNYTLLYNNINGLIVVFSIEGVDYENGIIEGYFFNPKCEKRQLPWGKGVFPIPNSIFQRITLDKYNQNKLKSITQNCIFNSSYFNKWEFWIMVSRCSSVKYNIPYTRILNSLDDVDFIINKYGSSYIKPINGTLAQGIYKINKHLNTYLFKKKNKAQKLSRKQAKEYINNTIKDKKYIVQQPIEAFTIDGRHMDFRVIMQKDYTKEWMCTGIISFTGIEGDICSNSGGELLFEYALEGRLKLSRESTFIIKQNMIDICKKICKILDSSGENYGDLGFDVVLDKNLRVWVLEVNKRQYHSTPLWVGDIQTFYAVKTNPIKYAAALGGFTIY